MQMISLASENSGKMTVVIRFMFYAFLLYAAIRRNATLRIARVSCTQQRVYVNRKQGF
jgi:hypothetical protein